jgi:hypothetical protein
MDAATLSTLVEKTTDKWAKQRKKEERDYSAAMRRYEFMTRMRRVTIKEAAWACMEAAYLKASAGNTLPAAARQIMYAARGSIQERTGKALDDQYFCQTLLPDYMAEHPDETAEWDVVFDARGNFTEPHTEERIPLGTLQVRSYLRGLSDASNDDVSIEIERLYPTAGPANRFSAILFLEKEGFGPLLEKVKLAERYDIAIMSTKGLSVTAARHLVDELCAEYEVPLLIARDFDKAGFSIAGTLQNDTRRYAFANDFEVVDLGLRLDDVERWGLESETVAYGKTDPSRNLLENGATADEVAFLLDGYSHQGSGYHGRRVELNAFTSDKLVQWLEAKLDEHGIEKVVPDDETLAAAYRRACEVAKIQKAIDRIAKAKDTAEVPEDLAQTIRERLAEDPSEPWDQVLAEIAAEREDG